jgi:hypothetical protein
MKNLYQTCIVFIVLLVGLSLKVSAQVSMMPENLIGTDLRKAEADLRKALDRGQKSQTINLAEVLYYSGQFEEALKLYQQADSMNLLRNPQQRRNYTHVAKMFNVGSPYGESTGYFDRDWAFEAETKAFCGNSRNEDFAPFKWNNMLFITSSREATRRVYDFSNKPFLNVYAFEDECSPVSLPGFLPKDINTRYHDGPISISADTNLVVITRNYRQPNESGYQNLYLEYFVRENGNWGKGIQFPYGRQAFSVQHPYFHDEESTLYYASNMPGGQGGFDIYKSKWDGQRWESPVNLGPEVNSSYDEVFPSISPKGDLIYSTNHIESMGGLDLVMFRDGVRTLFPEPVNSPFDDFALIFADDMSGYFSSNRSGGPFGDNIYSFTIPEPLPVEHNFFAKVIDKETGKGIEGALVAFSSFEKGISGSILTNSSGEGYLFRSIPGFPAFSFDVSKPGFQTFDRKSDNYKLDGERYVYTFELEKEVEPLIAGDIKPETESGTIVLYFENDIPRVAPGGPETIARYYETFNIFNQARSQYFQRSASSKEELEAFFKDLEDGMTELEAFAGFVLEELKAGQKFMIDLAAFASPLASHEYNARLSERRNQSVKNYFRNWQGGAMRNYIDNGSLHFLDKAYGDTQAPPSISEDPNERDKSVYSVRASRERRVVLFWKRVEK